jgi:hypothetical protein
MGDARRNADDPSELSLAHTRDKSARTEEIPAEIDIDRPIPILLRHIRDQRARIDSGIIHKDIDTAKTFEDLIRKTFHRRFGGNVNLDLMALSPCGAQLFGNTPGLVRLQVGYDDLGSFAAETHRNRTADSLRTTGHDGDSLFVSHGVTKPPLTCSV